MTTKSVLHYVKIVKYVCESEKVRTWLSRRSNCAMANGPMDDTFWK